jgi:hypothetical protein
MVGYRRVLEFGLRHEGELRKRGDLSGPIRDIRDLPRDRIRDTYIFICYVSTY